jgi:hypothetical protein
MTRYDAPLIDPRPLEPDWVRDAGPEPSGLIEWQVITRHWNKKILKYEVEIEHHEGTPKQFLDHIGIKTIAAAYGEFTLKVDARQAMNVPKGYSDVKHRENNDIYWVLDYNIEDGRGGSEEDSDVDELMGWMIYLMNEKAVFKVELDFNDPTPAYLEINSMF